MTPYEADREILEIIAKKFRGEAQEGDEARHQALLAWRRRNLFPLENQNDPRRKS